MRKFNKFGKSKLLYADIFGNGYMSYKLNDNFSLIYTYLWKFNNGFLKEVSNCYKKMRKGKQKHYKLAQKRIRNWKFGQRFSSYVLLRVFMSFYFNVKKHQLRKYFVRASKKRGAFVDNFLFLLEMRLDMFLFRSFPCFSLGFIRQFILHTGLLVNRSLVQHISFNLRHNDTISFLGDGPYVHRVKRVKCVNGVKKRVRIKSLDFLDRSRSINCRKEIKANTSVPLRDYIRSFFLRRRRLRKPFVFIRPLYSLINYNKFFVRVNCESRVGFGSKVSYPFGLNLDSLYPVIFEKLK